MTTANTFLEDLRKKLNTGHVSSRGRETNKEIFTVWQQKYIEYHLLHGNLEVHQIKAYVMKVKLELKIGKHFDDDAYEGWYQSFLHSSPLVYASNGIVTQFDFVSRTIYFVFCPEYHAAENFLMQDNAISVIMEGMAREYNERQDHMGKPPSNSIPPVIANQTMIAKVDRNHKLIIEPATSESAPSRLYLNFNV